MLNIEKIREVAKKLEEENSKNNNPIYDSHIYWAKKPNNIVLKIINKLSCVGDIVLDPFMGFGGVIFETLSLKGSRKVIGNDINELPVFLAKALLVKYDLERLKVIFDEFINDLRNDFEKFYYTKCFKCKKVRIADRFIFDKKNDEFELKQIKYTCKNCFGGNRKPTKKPDINDINLFKNEYKIDKKYFKDIKLIENSRIAVKKNEKISDLFTKRSLFLINEIIKKIKSYKDKNIKDFLRISLSSILHLAKITDLHSNSQWLLWFPEKNCLEKNIINLFEKRGKKIIRAVNYLNNKGLNKAKKVKKFKDLKDYEKAYMLLSKPAQNIRKYIPRKSISLIVTDPPYVDQIPYSEYMQLYSAFIYKKYNLEEEIVVSNAVNRNKDEENYFNLINKVFRNMNEVLKKDGILSIFFHDNRIRFWNKLLKIAKKNGFKYITQVHIHRNKKTIKNIMDPKRSLQGNALMFFIKSFDVKDRIAFFDKKIIKKADQIIRKKKGATTAQLYDNGVLDIIIDNDYMDLYINENKDLIDFFEQHYEFYKGKWHFKDNVGN